LKNLLTEKQTKWMNYIYVKNVVKKYHIMKCISVKVNNMSKEIKSSWKCNICGNELNDYQRANTGVCNECDSE